MIFGQGVCTLLNVARLGCPHWNYVVSVSLTPCKEGWCIPMSTLLTYYCTMVLSYASKNDNNVDQCIEFWQFLVLDHGRHVGETLDDDGNCTLRRNPSGKLSFDDL